MNNKSLFVFFFSIFSLLLFSCADSTPSILSVNAFIVYEFKDETSKPVERLSVFVQPDTEAERFKEMTVESLQTGYVWKIQDAQIMSSGKKNYVGNSFLLPYWDEHIPTGDYRVVYKDCASRTAERSFTIREKKSLVEAPVSTLNYNDIKNKKTAKDFVFDRVVLYGENKEIVYYGGNKRDFNNVAEIRKIYPDARKMCTARITADSMYALVLAPVELPEWKDNTEKKPDDEVIEDENAIIEMENEE
jgi:hypothetical protein